VVDDPVHHGIVRQEVDDLHRSPALETRYGIRLVDLADHRGLALGGEAPEFLLDNQERKRPKACLPDLTSVGIGVQAVIAESEITIGSGE